VQGSGVLSILELLLVLLLVLFLLLLLLLLVLLVVLSACSVGAAEFLIFGCMFASASYAFVNRK
jgi:hypothetical protein